MRVLATYMQDFAHFHGSNAAFFFVAEFKPRNLSARRQRSLENGADAPERNPAVHTRFCISAEILSC
jgi:hypothetical protein